MSATVKAIRVHRSRRRFLRAEPAAPRRPRLTAPCPARPARPRRSRRSPRWRCGTSGVRAVLPPAVSAPLPRPPPPTSATHTLYPESCPFFSPNPSKLFILDLKTPIFNRIFPKDFLSLFFLFFKEVIQFPIQNQTQTPQSQVQIQNMHAVMYCVVWGGQLVRSLTILFLRPEVHTHTP